LHITVSVSWIIGTVQGTAHLECASTSNMYCTRNGTPGLCQHLQHVLCKELHTWTMSALPTCTEQGTAHVDYASTSNTYCTKNGTPRLCQHFQHVLYKERHNWTVPALTTYTVQGTAHLECASTYINICRQSNQKLSANPQT
jgi:hypothetical protein